MGYGKRDNGITTFWPDDTDVEFYMAEGASLEEILTLCREKWGDQCLLAGNIRIDSEFIHTDCLGYDLMDFGDYTKFLKITNTNL